jgi:hypothetical protein
VNKGWVDRRIHGQVVDLGVLLNYGPRFCGSLTIVFPVRWRLDRFDNYNYSGIPLGGSKSKLHRNAFAH